MTLIDRLSKLDGADREVDAEIWLIELQSAKTDPFGGYGLAEDWRHEYEAEEDGSVSQYACNGQVSTKIGRCHSPKFTSSVDAAIALARRLWPDVMYRVGNHAEGYDPSLYLGEIFIPGETQRDYFNGVSSSDAIALCIAILRAKEALNG